MRTIQLTYKCDLNQCPYINNPVQCIDSSVMDDTDNQENWICPHLNAYLTPQTTTPATPECLHRQHKCQECQQDHTTDWLYCQSPKKRQKT